MKLAAKARFAIGGGLLSLALLPFPFAHASFEFGGSDRHRQPPNVLLRSLDLKGETYVWASWRLQEWEGHDSDHLRLND